MYTGPAAPLTSLALSVDNEKLFSGCWDKTIWSWDTKSKAQRRRYAGHSDFVKCIACLKIASGAAGGTTDVLVSGGQDAAVIVWDMSTGNKLHILRGHTMGVLDLAIEPPDPAANASQASVPPSLITIWSAGSDRSVLRWQVGVDLAKPLPFIATSDVQQSKTNESELDSTGFDMDQVVRPSLVIHETSINRLRFAFTRKESDQKDHDGLDQSLTMLTASSDKSAKLSRRVVRITSESQADSWRPIQTFPHPDFVRDMLLLSDASGGASGDEGLVATACRDEEVRMWDLEDPDSVEPLCVYTGHYEEVTGLVVRNVDNEPVLVSISIDATIRTWPASYEGIRNAQRAEEARSLKEQELDGHSPAQIDADLASGAIKTLLTVEEERELEELMSDDD